MEKDWIPTAEGTSLYIRPTIIGSETAIGVKASTEYVFYIIVCPVGMYYARGGKPVKLHVEEFYSRAATGGTGAVKCAGNYAASLRASENAKKNGCDQVMWLDACEKKVVEEVGSMNIFFVIDGEVVTPALSGNILPGITRKSVIEILKKEGKRVSERTVTIDELTAAAESGRLTEVFGTGTAVVVSTVGSLVYKGKEYKVSEKAGPMTEYIYDKLTGIQTGRYKDDFNWVSVI
jgi:branched-chain amino acid aminotransferase